MKIQRKLVSVTVVGKDEDENFKNFKIYDEHKKYFC